MEIPQNINELTKEILANALKMTVKSFKVEQMSVGRGYLGVITPIEVETVEHGVLQLVAKLSPRDSYFRAFAVRHNAFEREAWFYNDLLPKLEKFIAEDSKQRFFFNLPKVYFAHCQGERTMILMENLTSKGFKPVEGDLSLDMAITFVRTLARFHGAIYAYQTKFDIDWRNDSKVSMEDVWNNQEKLELEKNGGPGWFVHGISQVIERVKWSRDRYDDATKAKMLAKLERWLAEYEKHLLFAFSSEGKRFPVLGHCDTNIGNMMFNSATKEMILIDWQVCKPTSMTMDIFHALHTAMDPIEQRKHQEKILEAYHTELSKVLSYFGFDAESSGMTLDALKAEAKLLSPGILCWIAIIVAFKTDDDSVPEESTPEAIAAVMEKKQQSMTEDVSEKLLAVAEAINELWE